MQKRELPRTHPDRATWMKQLCVCMDDDTRTQIDLAAKAAGLNRSEWVRLRLEWALEDESTRQPGSQG